MDPIMLTIKVTVTATGNPKVFNVTVGESEVTTSGRAELKRALTAETAAQVQRLVDSFFPGKAPAEPTT